MALVHPGNYRGSDHAHNAAGGVDELITHHPLDVSPTDDVDSRHFCYRELFSMQMEHGLVHGI